MGHCISGQVPLGQCGVQGEGKGLLVDAPMLGGGWRPLAVCSAVPLRTGVRRGSVTQVPARSGIHTTLLQLLMNFGPLKARPSS